MASGSSIRVLDLFCGAGGSSCGAQMAGGTIVGGIDAWETAIDTHKLNYPGAKRWHARLEDLSVAPVAKVLGRVDLIVASPECTNHTHAKGKRHGTAEEDLSRRTALQVPRFVRGLRPRWVVVENVVSMKRWELYQLWMDQMIGLGYQATETTLDAQDFGVPQGRRRLFILFDRQRTPTVPRPLGTRPGTVKSILCTADSNGHNYTLRPLRTAGRAPDTIARADRAIAKLGERSSFLIVYYGTDAAGGWQSLDRPLRTITTLDRFALVEPSPHGHLMRMLQPQELALAMGFPKTYRWPDCTRREHIKLIGNAVAPPVMREIVRALVSSPTNDEKWQQGYASVGAEAAASSGPLKHSPIGSLPARVIDC